jgi:hypothetical protein
MFDVPIKLLPCLDDVEKSSFKDVDSSDQGTSERGILNTNQLLALVACMAMTKKHCNLRTS